MARCLVTGHKGYIGSRLIKELQNQGHEVMGIDLNDKVPRDINSFSGLKEDQQGNFHPAYWHFKPEYVFHLACIPRVAYSVEEPVETMHNNVLAGSNVLNFARKVGAKRVIYSSSSSIIGNGSGPTSPYALQKMTTEIETRLYAELYGIDTVSLRYFNVYSEDQKADGPYATAICNWMQYIRDGKNPFITGDGKQRRDMLHVSDAVAANIFAMEYDGKFNGNNFDCGTGVNICLNDVKKIVLKYFPDVQFEYTDARPGDVMVTMAKQSPVARLGWQAKVGILEGIHKCFETLKGELQC